MRPAVQPPAVFHFADRLPSVIDALTRLRDSVAAAVRSPHAYIIPSAQQADAAARVYYQWTKSGQVGPEPQFDRGTSRSLIYLRGNEAAKIAAFLAASRTTTFEITDQALTAFERHYWVVAFGLCRSLIERIALAGAWAEMLSKFLSERPAPNERPLDSLIDNGDAITRFLYGTKRDWTKLAEMDFTKSSSKEGDYSPLGDGVIDFNAKSILTYADKLNKRIPGVRIVYDVLSEFVHPNCGDLFAATLKASAPTDEFGTRLIKRYIGVGERSFAGQHEFDHLMGKCCPILVETFDHLLAVHQKAEEYHKEAMRRTQMAMRRILKKNGRLFVRGDLCPCASGRTFSTCCGR